MAGNQEVTDLPIIPAVDGADVYAAKNNLDYRIRTGEPGGLATLGGDGKLPLAQLPAGAGTVTSVAVANATGITWTGSPITTAGTLTPILSANLQSWSGITPATKADTSALSNYVLKAGDTVTGSLQVNGTVVCNSDFPFKINTAGFSYIESNSPHIAYYKKNSGGVTSYYWRRSDNGLVGGPNETQLAELTDAGIYTVTGQVRSTGGSSGIVSIDRTSGRLWNWYGSSDIFRLYNGSSDILTIDASGNCVATNFTGTSDANLKKDITDYLARDRLADMLRFVEFTWKATDEKALGLIAQEVREVAPEYVIERDGILSIDKAGIALECVIGLAARVRELEERL